MIDAVDVKIASLGDWRGALLTRIRQLIKEAVTDVVEEVKWRKPTNPLGVPTWSHAGVICTGESYSDKVKLTFPKGSSLSDPRGRCCQSNANSSLHDAFGAGEGRA